MMTFSHDKVAVLYGGDSAEREVSLASGKAVANGLTQSGINAELIDTKSYDIARLKSQGFDRVFIALHGRGGEDGRIQGALEYMGIPYTGSGVLGSALSMDKARCKQIWQSIGLPTAAFKQVYLDEYEPEHAQQILDSLGQKVMVKPCHEGSSIGMAIAEGLESLQTALATAFKFDSQVLVEQWIDGPEYTVAIVGQEALPAIHMETPRSFYDYEAKYKSTTTQYHCPCGLPAEEEYEVQQLALRAFKSANASGWGRVDFMKSANGEWQILEVNTVPGMTETSLVPKAARVAGYSFNELTVEILKSSLVDK